RSALRHLSYHSQVFMKPNHEALHVMNHFYDYPKAIDMNAGNKEITKESVEELYARIKAKHSETKDQLQTYDVQHRFLYPTLRPYQCEAVQWMLNREHIETIGSHQHLYETVVTIDGTCLEYNRYMGYFISGKSEARNYIYGVSQSGILADEMGLGKTIEVLSCILSNPRPQASGDQSSTDSYHEYNAPELIDWDSNGQTEECFACVCGLISNIRAYRRRKLIIFDTITDEGTDHFQCDAHKRDDYNSDDNDGNNDDNSDTEVDEEFTDEWKNNFLAVEDIRRYRRRSKKLAKKLAEKMLVRCRGCGSYQHAVCVNYKVETRRPYYCGHCWARPTMKRVDSRATLIVSPRSISHQWQDEITKHVDCTDLNVYVYEGVKSAEGYVQPFDLADNDIVLTTYETLRSEIDFVDLHHSNRFRNPKRFNATPSPLLSINWWRVCLDEAQMVESASAKTAQMAHRLWGQHRWAITGTPVQRSVDDLYGLLLFIGEEPFHERHYWDKMLYYPYASGNYQPMVEALRKCFWRTSKQEVWDQLGIPAQTSTIARLQFSPVEQHFYSRQHSECKQKFTEKMVRFSNLDVKLKELDKKTANIVMKPMLSLRQACCHPQAVRGKFVPISKKTLTMDELLKDMIKNTQYECEEEHRKIISSVNGMAGIHIIEKDYEKAIEFYRRALNSIESYKAKDLFRTDKLQLIHTLHNLAEIMELCGVRQKDKHSDEYYNKENENQPKRTEITLSVDFGRTLRDEYLNYESIQLHDEYLAKGTAGVAEVTAQLTPLEETVEQLEDSFQSLKQNPWWKSAIDYLRAIDEEQALIGRVKDVLEAHDLHGMVAKGGGVKTSQFVSISEKFAEGSGLKYVLDKCLRELHHSRSVVRQRVKSLRAKPTDTELNQAIDCHLRPEKDKEGNRAQSVVKCKYCLIHELFNDYEKKLYYFSVDEKTEEAGCKSAALMEKLRHGTWADSETEQCLKEINKLFRLKTDSGDNRHAVIRDDGQNHLKLFDALKKEFRGLRAVWIEIYDYVALIDELNMATIRLRVRFPDEPKPKETITYILEPSEVPTQMLSLHSDEVVAKNALQYRLSRLYYLNNLSKDDSKRKGGHNPDMCPICHFEMGEQWSVMQCGHSLCVKCLDIMLAEYSRRTGAGLSIQCAMCREYCPASAVLYVNSTAGDKEADQLEVAGSWSTKVEEVVRCLLQIVADEPTAKSLVFSTWTDVLQLISNALVDNQFNHCFIANSSKFSQKVDTFKQNPEIKALLMAIDLGAKGLNLIEATHVILVEPTLNKANELQAVGRVHRIGQTKPTFVHRFIVKNTIEERISSLYSIDGQTEGSADGPLSPQLLQTSEHAFITLNQMKRLFDGN
ncbi:unnamed protein product, partial [Medioppia subpectinata]